MYAVLYAFHTIINKFTSPIAQPYPVVVPTFDFSTLQDMTDEFHWRKHSQASTLAGLDIIEIKKGSTFWHGTSLHFPDHALPLGVAFYGDINVASRYAKKNESLGIAYYDRLYKKDYIGSEYTASCCSKHDG